MDELNVLLRSLGLSNLYSGMQCYCLCIVETIEIGCS